MTAPLARDLAEGDTTRTWRMPPPIRGVRAAFVFMTRLPVGGFPYRREDWSWAAAHAPFVGLVVGAVLGGFDRLLLPLGALSAALLTLGLSLFMTGAFHEDGLADTSDALGGAHDRSRIFEILKDSRIGVFGAAALVVSIAGRAALVAQLGSACVWALPLVGCAARVGPTWLMGFLPYVTPMAEAKSHDVARGGYPQVMAATAWLALALGIAISAGFVTPVRSFVLGLVMGGVALVTGHRYERRAGGVTGDFLGATEQLSEIAALAVLAWPS